MGNSVRSMRLFLSSRRRLSNEVVSTLSLAIQEGRPFGSYWHSSWLHADLSFLLVYRWMVSRDLRAYGEAILLRLAVMFYPRLPKRFPRSSRRRRMPQGSLQRLSLLPNVWSFLSKILGGRARVSFRKIFLVVFRMAKIIHQVLTSK